MSRFELQLETNNAAFDGRDAFTEIARILREAANNIEDGYLELGPGRGGSYPLRDVNGNPVGSYIHVARERTDE